MPLRLQPLFHPKSAISLISPWFGVLALLILLACGSGGNAASSAASGSDFTLQVNPVSVTVAQDQSVASFIYVTPTGAGHPRVDLVYSSDVPEDLMPSFDPATTDGRSMLMFMPMRSLAPGVYSVGINGVAGSHAATTRLYVTVTSAPPTPIPQGANVVITWNNAALQAIRDFMPGPPMTARALAIMHTCIYDAWSAYDAVAKGTRIGGSLRRPLAESTASNKRKAVSYAAYRALVDLFPADQTTWDLVMTSLGYDPSGASMDPTTPQGVGNLAAAAVLAFRHGDGANQLGDLNPGGGPYADYTGYQPLNPPIWVTKPSLPGDIPNPGHWQPLTYVNHAKVTVTPKYIGPYWGRVLPFAMTSGSQFRPMAPLPWGDPGLKTQIDEIIGLEVGLTDTQKCIAEYWADGPNSEQPPGHFNLFAQFVSIRDAHTLDDDVKLFFALTNAIFDAGIACWDAKRAYDYCRPVSAIRAMYMGQTIQGWRGAGLGVGIIDGGSWKPFQPGSFPTPPFPEYTSGHSAFSAAAAEVLFRFTGSDAFGNSATIPAHSLKAELGSPSTDVTLTWPTFSSAADEAGMSRRYGGIHFQDGDLRSRAMGRSCGSQAYLAAQAFWEGRSIP